MDAEMGLAAMHTVEVAKGRARLEHRKPLRTLDMTIR